MVGECPLACQCVVTEDMQVCPLMKFSESVRPNPGQRPQTDTTPEPEWIQRPMG